MRKRLTAFSLLLPLVVALVAFVPRASGQKQDVTRHMVIAELLPNVPGHRLTAVTVELAPGVTVPAHRHDAFVFAYVVEGVVRSQLDDGELIEYGAGESWVEPPDVTHSLTQNPSDSDPAKILAVFVATADAELTTSGAIAGQPE